MDSETKDRLVGALVEARQQRRTLDEQAWSSTVQTPEQAYAVQDGVAARLGWFTDGPPLHWKTGGSHAPMPPAGARTSPADYSDTHFNGPGIEAEIALRLGSPVTPELAAALTQESATALVDAMAVSIEVVDSRLTDRSRAPALLKLADQQTHGALAMGAWVPFAARDWAAQQCEIRIGNQEPVHKTGTCPQGDPTRSLVGWLRHATRFGTLPAGAVVSTGTWCGVLPAKAGDTVTVTFPGVGSATCRL
ncbi:MAG: fumarylacetoacetate hydrolase family protein [Pseudomonadota bacterium]